MSSAAQIPEKSDFPATFDLLETKVRFESNGDSRKEVHAIVKIHSELGVRQFANLNFDFNRAFQSVDIPLVRITHSSGGTADILPSAITDNPNPAVVNFPAYHNVRVKSLRILGLAPGDTLEYRVITTTTHHPLAPDFWFDHSFDRTGVVSHELFELDFPLDRSPYLWFNPTNNPSSRESKNGRNYYRWDLHSKNVGTTDESDAGNSERRESDLTVTTFQSWNQFSNRLHSALLNPNQNTAAVQTKAFQLGSKRKQTDALESLYDFVSQRITTVDLPLSDTGFRPRSPEEVLQSGYGTSEDKCVLLRALATFIPNGAALALVQSDSRPETAGMPRPSAFDNILCVVFRGHSQATWMDPSVAVAPYGLIRGQLRGKPALLLNGSGSSSWEKISKELPFPASQNVAIEATIRTDGALVSKVRYRMRGDNELILRLAFHQSPREKWTEVAQLLALSDGFRGKVTSATASDPFATHDPFTVEYEITQPKFVDWSKSPVQIPAILPLVGLPDPPAAQSASASQGSSNASAAIELGTPLDVHTTVTLHLPPGSTVESPAGTTVNRDYATFSSTYAASGTTITASRHIRFISRELPADRASDYNAFVHAVQSDQSLRFTLFAPASAPTAAPKATAPNAAAKP